MVCVWTAALLVVLQLWGASAEELSSAGSEGRTLKQLQGQQLPEDFKPPPLSCENGGPFPYMVSVRDRNGDHLCGGVVIRDDAVLTSAHCIDPRISAKIDPLPLLFISGWDRDSPVEKRKAIKRSVPKSWTGNEVDGSDIAVLIMNETTCVSPVFSLGSTPEDGDDASFVGFGRTATGGAFSFLLQTGVFSVLGKQNCSNFELKTALDHRALCVRGPNSGGVCAGDDGGPLIVRPTLAALRDKLVGIASYNTGECTALNTVSIFTRVQVYKWWIIAEVERMTGIKGLRKKSSGKDDR